MSDEAPLLGKHDVACMVAAVPRPAGVGIDGEAQRCAIGVSFYRAHLVENWRLGHPGQAAQRVDDDLPLQARLGRRRHVLPTAPAAPPDTGLARWLDPFGRRPPDECGHALGEVFPRLDDLDVDEFAG